MIKINLLPFRAARKKENVRRQISIYALSVIFLFVAMSYFYLSLNSQLKALQAEKSRNEQELATYAHTTKRINEVKKKVKEIQSKLVIIRGLEKNKTGPVELLDEIARAVPKGKLWLNSLQQRGETLNLTGTATDNDTVALFMTNLEKEKQIVSVDLRSSQTKKLTQPEIDVSDFSLICKTGSQKGKQKPKTTKRRRRR
ncbi:MAG: PilN domain-containing protein [Thermodesulfobacteriota bacterium]|nr:PilN domain-containing protein [Thermodesulfobacteriota bacterium]